MSNRNEFLACIGKHAAFTANGAVSNSTSGNLLVDQFSKSGSAVGRTLQEVFADQSSIWGQDELSALKFAFYLRLITRKVRMSDGTVTDSVQKGQGNADESLKRLLWVAIYKPDTFYKNLWILPLVGSWKDMWIMMSMSDELKKEEFFKVIAMGLNEKSQCGLVLKYLPRIRSMKKCKSDWAKKTNKLAKEFCDFLGITEREYRKMKSSGNAHKFQQVITAGLYDMIDFNTIPGRALFGMVRNNGQFLKAHNLYDKYINWLSKQPVAKFTGYVYELAMACGNRYNFKSLSLAEKMTIDKQFDGLIELAKQDKGGITGNVWCCLDTSGSMNTSVRGTKALCCDIANSLALYFSTLNEGAFHKCIMSFDDVSHFYKLSGTFTDMMSNLPRVGCGGTNFQGAIDEIIRVRKENPNIPLKDYPKTILVVSDMQFNPSGGYSYRIRGNGITMTPSTNYETMKEKLMTAFPKEFVDDMKFIWWHVTASYKDFPATIDDPGCYMFSGFDGAIITLLLGGDNSVVQEDGTKRNLTMEEMVDKALNQEILSFVKI